ncbi:MAG: T9SS type B sorting domain-containing protein [Bacteroidota bacterium]
MKSKNWSLLIGVIYFVALSIFQSTEAQNVINNGNAIVVNQGAYFIVGGDFVNKTATVEGRVDIDGTILLDGNFINYSTNQVFVNQEAVPDGRVVMRNNTITQSIAGTQPTHFENIEMHGSNKILEATNSGAQGVLLLDAVFKLNSNNFILYNNQPTAINHVSNYILSETNSVDGYGTLDWKIGGQTSAYSIPFGTGSTNSDDVELKYISQIAGSPSTAGIKFATYPSGDRYNLPYPTGISSLSPYEPLNVSDRYWITDADDYVSRPFSSLIFKYTNHDVESGNSIIESNLKAIRASSGDASWASVPPAGIVSPDINTMSVMNIPVGSWRTNWTMTSIEVGGEFWVPSAYTPNEDGQNDVFAPVFGFIPTNYTLDLFDRWGELIYSTHYFKQGWDGIYKGELAQQAVYVWKITMVKPDGKEYTYHGNFTLIR